MYEMRKKIDMVGWDSRESILSMWRMQEDYRAYVCHARAETVQGVIMAEGEMNLRPAETDDFINDAMDSLFQGGHKHVLIVAKGNVPCCMASYAIDDLETLAAIKEAFECECNRIEERLTEGD